MKPRFPLSVPQWSEAGWDESLEYKEIQEYSLHINSRSFNCSLSEGNEDNLEFVGFCGQ